MADEIEIPVLVKEPKTPDGSIGGISKYSQVFNKLYRTVLTNPWVIAAIATVAFLKKSVTAWAEQEKAINALNRAMINQGQYTRSLSAMYQDMALSIQKKTEYGDEEVIKAQASLQALIGGKRITERMMMAVADFASKNKMDLVSAAEAVGRTVGGSNNALARYGVEVESNSHGAERLEQVLSGIETKWQGQAEASVQGMGAVRQMQNALTGVMEMVGRSLTPFVGAMAQQAAVWARELAESTLFLDGITLLVNGVEVLTATLNGAVEAISQSVVTVLQSQFRAAAQALKGNFSRAWQELKDGGERAGEAMTSKRKEVGQKIQELLERERRASETRAYAEESTTKRVHSETIVRRQERHRSDDEMFKQMSIKELQEGIAKQNLERDAQYIDLTVRIRRETDKTKKYQLEKKRQKIAQEEIKRVERRYSEKETQFSLIRDEQQARAFGTALDIISGFQDSKISELVIIAKAAAITKITTDAIESIAFTMEAMVDLFGEEVGGIIGLILSVLIGGWAAERIAGVAGISLYGDQPDPPGEMKIDQGEIWKKAALAVGLSLTMVAANSIPRFFLGGYKSVSPDDFADDFLEWNKDHSEGGIEWEDPGDTRGPGEKFPGPGGTPTVPIEYGLVSAVPSSGGYRQQVNVTIEGGVVPTRSQAKLIASAIHNGRT